MHYDCRCAEMNASRGTHVEFLWSGSSWLCSESGRASSESQVTGKARTSVCCSRRPLFSNTAILCIARIALSETKSTIPDCVHVYCFVHDVNVTVGVDPATKRPSRLLQLSWEGPSTNFPKAYKCSIQLVPNALVSLLPIFDTTTEHV